ncbi:MAG: acyl-CoA thioesterase [Gammaproteobacteria bacterium]|nr:acyl-CoA thioesterase [Gammaproteobacteria bacterium]
MSAWDFPDPFTQTVRVLGTHIDVLAHANNAVYVNWCQDVAWAHSEHLGVAPSAYRELDRAMAVRTATYEYLDAALEGEELEIGNWITASDARLQMRRHFQMRRVRDAATVFRGDWELVCIRISSGKPVRMPRLFLDRYEPAVRR